VEPELGSQAKGCVAMSSGARPPAGFDGWARYYDLIAGDRTGMAAFYCGLVGNETRRILDLACGTGVITGALAQRFAERPGASQQTRVVGVDESAAMLRIARARDARPEWILGDMRWPPVQGPFDLVVCCYNTVQSLVTDVDLSVFLSSVASVIGPKGVFAFDIMQPDLPYLDRTRQEHVARTVFDEGTRRQLQHLRKYSYDARSGILSIKHRLVGTGGQVIARLDQRYRQYSTSEIERALACAGLFARRRYGDLDGSRLTTASKRQIFVCVSSSTGWSDRL
jgi:ubiquinone/menaquinone biosynthesis C-methylase UbiE